MSEPVGLVSVVMPAYNRETLIEESIRSVLNQTYKDFELIIVDDCSSDSTLEVIRRVAGDDPRVKVISHETNKGAAEARLTGASEASSEWIALIDSDDLWDSEKLTKQIQCQKNTDADAVYSASAYIREDGKKLNYIFHVPTTTTYKKLLKQNVMSNSSVMVRKDLFLQYAKVSAPIHEDYKCWLSLLKNGYKVAGIDEPLMTYRLTEQSTTTNKSKSSKMTWNTYKVMGVNFISRCFYMCCYMFKSVLKYIHIL